jgi:hypothetical protein
MFYTCAFNNTKVNGFFFINLELIVLFTRYYSTRFKPLSYVILVIGYNSKDNSRIMYYIRLTLQINNRWFIRMLFYIILLKKHNIIISRK